MPDKTENKNRGTIHSFLDSYFPGSKIPYRTLAPVLIVGVFLLLALWLGSSGVLPFRLSGAGAGPTLTATKPPVVTSNACLTAIIRGDVEKVHAVMLEFYDASALASQTPADQLIQVIPGLQEIRRRAEALKVSGCLDKMRSFQISHMNMVINTLLAFMSKSDQSILVEGIIQARLLNEEYKKEKARLLGETYVPPASRTFTPTAGTVTPAGTATP